MSTLAGLCKGPKGEPDALDGVSEGLRAELLTLTSSGSVRLAHWRARRHDVSAELYAWLNREYARLGPYRRGRGEREQHALTRRGLTLEKCRLEDAAGRTRCVDQPPPAGFTAGPRWRTARIPAARSGSRWSCAIARRCWEERSTRVAICASATPNPRRRRRPGSRTSTTTGTSD